MATGFFLGRGVGVVDISAPFKISLEIPCYSCPTISTPPPTHTHTHTRTHTHTHTLIAAVLTVQSVHGDPLDPHRDGRGKVASHLQDELLVVVDISALAGRLYAL